MRVENRTFHGLDVKVMYGDVLDRYRDTRIEVAGDGWGRTVRDMGHDNVDEDIAHEVRVWLLRVQRKTLHRAKGWKVAA